MLQKTPLGAFCFSWLRGRELNPLLEVMHSTSTFAARAQREYVLQFVVWTIPSSSHSRGACRLVSTPSPTLFTESALNWRLARYCHFKKEKGFTEFDRISIDRYRSRSPYEPPEVPFLYPALSKRNCAYKHDTQSLNPSQDETYTIDNESKINKQYNIYTYAH